MSNEDDNETLNRIFHEDPPGRDRRRFDVGTVARGEPWRPEPQLIDASDLRVHHRVWVELPWPEDPSRSYRDWAVVLSVTRINRKAMGIDGDGHVRVEHQSGAWVEVRFRMSWGDIVRAELHPKQQMQRLVTPPGFEFVSLHDVVTPDKKIVSFLSKRHGVTAAEAHDWIVYYHRQIHALCGGEGPGYATRYRDAADALTDSAACRLRKETPP